MESKLIENAIQNFTITLLTISVSFGFSYTHVSKIYCQNCVEIIFCTSKKKLKFYTLSSIPVVARRIVM